MKKKTPLIKIIFAVSITLIAINYLLPITKVNKYMVQPPTHRALGSYEKLVNAPAFPPRFTLMNWLTKEEASYQTIAECDKRCVNLAEPDFLGYFGDASSISDELFYPNNKQIHVRIVRPLLTDGSGICVIGEDGICCAEDESRELYGVLRLYEYNLQSGESVFIDEYIVNNTRFKSFAGLSDSSTYYIVADGFVASDFSESIFVASTAKHPNMSIRHTHETIICRTMIQEDTGTGSLSYLAMENTEKTG